MKIGSLVQTEYGQGIVKNKEGEDGILSNRYLVKINNAKFMLSNCLFLLHEKQDGLYFLDKELQKKKD